MDKFDSMPYKGLINECKYLGINFVGKTTDQLRQELRKLDKQSNKASSVEKENVEEKQTIEKTEKDKEVIEKVEEQSVEIPKVLEKGEHNEKTSKKEFKTKEKIDNIVEGIEQSQIKIDDTVLFIPKGGESKIKGKVVKIYVYEKNGYTYNKILGEDGKKYDKQAKDIELCN